MTWREAFHQSPLARRLIVWTVLFSSAVTLVLTTFQLYRNYQRDIGFIEQNFADIKDVHLPTLTESMWATDQDRLQLQLDGMLKLRDMEYFEIREGSQVWARAGSNTSQNVIQQEIPILYQHGGQVQALGSLLVVATLDQVYARLLGEALTILISNGVKTFLVAMFMLLLIYFQVTRHLLSIGRFAQHLDLAKPAPPLTLDRAPHEDELHATVMALNQMHARLNESSERVTESEERFRATFDQAAVGFAHVGPGGRWLRVNQKLCDISGYAREELLGKTLQDITHPDDLDADLVLVRQVLAGEIQTYSAEKRYFRKDGRMIWVNLTVSLVRKPDGSPDYLISVVEDISTRKQADDALRDGVEKYRTIFEQATDGILISDAQSSRFLDANPAICRMLGYSQDELLKLSTAEIIIPDEVTRIEPEVSRLQDGKTVRSEWRLRHKDGSILYAEVTAKQLAGGRLQGFIRDITGLRAAEQESRRQQELLRAVVENSIDAIFIKDRVGRYLLINAACAEVIGRAPKDTIGRFDRDLFPADTAEAILRHDQEILEAGKVETFEETMPTALGVRTFLTTKIPLPDTITQDARLIGVARDITAQKRTEVALREREEILRLFVEHSPAAIAMLDTEMCYVAVSRRWLSDYGLGDRDLIGHSHYEIFPEVSQRWKDIHQRCLAGATERHDEDPFVRADGHTDWVKWEIRPWNKIEGGIGGIIIFSELVTQRKLAEAERDQLLVELTARNAEMENFVYTISHDLKSPLITIGGFSSLLERDITRGDNSVAADSLAEIKKAVGQMQSHIDDILQLSRVGRVLSERVEVPLVALLNEVIEKFGPRLNAEDVQLIIAPDLPAIRADRKGFQRVFTNLLDNALKYRRPGIAPQIEVGWQRSKKELLLFVRDNGTGIKKEYQDRIFGLFQRADSSTEGTGVGLAITKRVIEVHGGRMWVESKPGKGSTFWVGLPATMIVNT